MVFTLIYKCMYNMELNYIYQEKKWFLSFTMIMNLEDFVCLIIRLKGYL